MTAPVRETIVRFGPQQYLAGIISTPSQVASDAPHVVLVNSGIVHRVGPSRLYVEIARVLAAQGYPVLRFDLSGIGDSETTSSGASLIESAQSDIRSALDFLQTSRRLSSFVLCGLCSGANDSVLAAFSDPRVVGAILIDPSVHRTRRSVLLHFGRRLRHPATWRLLLTLRHPLFRRSLGPWRGMAAVNARSQSEQRSELSGRTTREIASELQRIIDRGVQLMLVFTGGINEQYNYRDQLFDLLPGVDFRQQLQLEFMPHTDHTISDIGSRSSLLAAMAAWMVRSFPAGTNGRRSV